jgi:hypothetical protein
MAADGPGPLRRSVADRLPGRVPAGLYVAHGRATGRCVVEDQSSVAIERSIADELAGTDDPKLDRKSSVRGKGESQRVRDLHPVWPVR